MVGCGTWLCIAPHPSCNACDTKDEYQHNPPGSGQGHIYSQTRIPSQCLGASLLSPLPENNALFQQNEVHPPLPHSPPSSSSNRPPLYREYSLTARLQSHQRLQRNPPSNPTPLYSQLTHTHTPKQSCAVSPNTCPECIRCCFDTCSGGTSNPNFQACYDRTCLNSPGGLGTTEVCLRERSSCLWFLVVGLTGWDSVIVMLE